jgi:hypothetical protein
VTGAGQDAFAASRERFGQVTGWLAGEEAAGLTADRGRSRQATPGGCSYRGSGLRL